MRGVGGGIIGVRVGGRLSIGDVVDPATTTSGRGRSLGGGGRARSSSPRTRHGKDTFSQPPRDALSLARTPASDRPVGLLGSVLRREAAIAAMKTAVQVPPPPPGRDRSKALRELAETLAEFRDATIDAINLLAARPEGSARFYWNGMDLVLKMLTDLQWAPLPQTVDPLLWKWFSYWSSVWSNEQTPASAASPNAFAVPDEGVLDQCRRAERKLLRMAHGASSDGSGMGGWALQEVADRVQTLLKVQQHRMTAAHSEGGANHAQRRRFANMESFLYGKEAVHLGHLKVLGDFTSQTRNAAASVLQRAWRFRSRFKRLRKEKGKQAGTGTLVDLLGDRDKGRRGDMGTELPAQSNPQRPGSAAVIRQGGSTTRPASAFQAPASPGRSFLREAQASVGLPDMV